MVGRWTERRALVAWIVVAACAGPAPTPDAGDDGGPRTCSADVDCDDGVFCNGTELCRPRAEGARPDGCLAATTAPCVAGQSCDEAHAACVTDCSTTRDADGDGHRAIVCGGDDCDDADAHAFPGNPEICDDRSHDEDCDDTTFGARDQDHDGDVDARCCNHLRADSMRLACGDDCNDQRRVVNPSATEACDGFDNDCDGTVDEGVTVVGFVDGDRDGFGLGPGVMVCAGTVGYALDGGDCDDADAAQRPAGPELCDGRDNDCDDRVDETPTAVTWYLDRDHDLYGSARSGTVRSCTPVDGYSLLGTDCDDARAGTSPGATELCNGRDDDCNGLADFAVAPGDYEDDDGDRSIDARCGGAGGDCDDLDPSTFPGAPEICDGRDNDCNGVGDDLTGDVAWYADGDGDGWGDGSDSVSSCAQPAGRVTRALDCDDSDPDRHPGLPDGCDGRDDDCDTDVDEDAPVDAYWRGDLDGDGFAGGAPTLSCRPIAGATTIGGDCDDTRAEVSPAASELCNGEDDDCDTATDEGFGTITCGVASCVRTVPACSGGMPTLCVPGTASPELCNGRDDDCSGVVDDEPAASGACRLAGASSVCRAGSCHVLACAAGLTDCNRADVDGCETALDTDPLSCGACGRACPMGQTCRGGHCSAEIVDLALGEAHSCALLGDGSVRCWGRNQLGQVGANAGAPYFSSATAVLLDAGTGPQALDLATGIDAARDTTCVTRASASSRIACWGSNDGGQTVLGVGSTTLVARGDGASSSRPVLQVAMGETWRITRDDTGQLTITGAYAHGEGGNGRYNDTGLPALSGTYPPLTSVITLATGLQMAFVRDASSPTTTYAWGEGTSGGLGGASTARQPFPTLVAIGDWSALALGANHGCLLRPGSGDVFCFGDDRMGQLGRGDAAPHVDVGAVGTTGVDVDAYGDTTCIVTGTGGVACWGANDLGQCGVAGPAPVLSPNVVPIPGGVAARSVAVGGHHTCAVLVTNQVVCWGQNAFGQLGDTTTTSSVAPVFVTGLP